MFGDLKCKVRYAIIILTSNTTFKFVTKIEIYPKKVFEYKDNEKAVLINDKREAERICFGMNANGFTCFVIEIPDQVFDEENLKNFPSD